MEGLCSSQDANTLLSIEDHWEISKVWSTDQGLEVAQAIVFGNTTGISYGSFKNNRGTTTYIIKTNKDRNSRIYAVHDTTGNKLDQSPYRSEIRRNINAVTRTSMCH